MNFVQTQNKKLRTSGKNRVRNKNLFFVLFPINLRRFERRCDVTFNLCLLRTANKKQHMLLQASFCFSTEFLGGYTGFLIFKWDAAPADVFLTIGCRVLSLLWLQEIFFSCQGFISLFSLTALSEYIWVFVYPSSRLCSHMLSRTAMWVYVCFAFPFFFF